MKKSVMFLLLSLVCLSVSAQNGKVKSGVIGGVSMDWYKDEAMSKGKVGFNIPDMKPSFHVGYQLQFELKHRLSVDAALLYGQKRGEIASVGNKATPVKGYKSKFARNYMALNGVLNYNLIGRLKVGVGVEPTLHFKDNIMIGKTIKSAFDGRRQSRLCFQILRSGPDIQTWNLQYNERSPLYEIGTDT